MSSETTIALETFDTVFTCARSLHQYLAALRRASIPDPQVAIDPVDAYVLRCLAAYADARPVVVDMAADATAGASTRLWLANLSSGRLVVLSRLRISESEGTLSWRDVLDREIPESSLSDPPIFSSCDAASALGTALGTDVGLDVVHREVALGGRLIVSIAAEDGVDAGPPSGSNAADGVLSAALQAVFDRWPHAVVLVMSFGSIGSSRNLDSVLRFCQTQTQYQLTAIRELSPFLSRSRFGLVSLRNDAVASELPQRIAKQFDGNFDYLKLVNTTIDAVTRLRALEATVAQLTPRLPATGDGTVSLGGAAGRAARLDCKEYATFVNRVRQFVDAHVPRPAVVAIASKGDDQFLEIDGRQSEHFPGNPVGAYIGFHPATSTEALSMLRQAIDRGVRWLVFPATSYWWFDHYVEFHETLKTRYRRVVQNSDCAIFDLREIGRTCEAQEATTPAAKRPRGWSKWYRRLCPATSVR